MLMMRLQRVGRKNDPSFRIVVTDKRTGVKSDKHVDRLGSYNPKLNHVQIDAEKAKEWLAKGVQPSDTMHNILVSQKVIEGKKRNVLPRKSPIIDEEAVKKAAEEAAVKAVSEEQSVSDNSEDTQSEAEKVAAEAPVEEAVEAEVEAEETDKEVKIVVDEDDPSDHSETATVEPEAIAKEEADESLAQADAEAD